MRAASNCAVPVVHIVLIGRYLYAFKINRFAFEATHSYVGPRIPSRYHKECKGCILEGLKVQAVIEHPISFDLSKKYDSRYGVHKENQEKQASNVGKRFD